MVKLPKEINAYYDLMQEAEDGAQDARAELMRIVLAELQSAKFRNPHHAIIPIY